MAHSDPPRSERAARSRPASACQPAWLAAVATLSACTELAPGGDRLPQQLQLNQRDAAPPAMDTPWSCIDDPISTAATPLVPRVELTLWVIDTVTDAPPPGLLARACSRLDVTCDAPLTADVGLAIDGALHLSVAQQFDGFVELRSPTTVPTMYFVNQPLLRDTSESFSVISTLALGRLAEQGNVMLDAMLGHVLIRVFDCEGNPASGVQLSIDKGGQVFAFVDGLPVVGRDETTDDGIGGFVNVAEDYVVLQGIVVEHERALDTASVTVRPGWFSYGDVEPSPQ